LSLKVLNWQALCNVSKIENTADLFSFSVDINSLAVAASSWFVPLILVLHQSNSIV
jgi:hypothetical protein